MVADFAANVGALASLIASVAALVGVFYARSAKSRADTAATSSQALTQPLNEVHAAVSTPPASPPLGQVVAEGAEAIADLREAVNGKNGH